MKFSEDIYRKIKIVAMIWLPAIASLYAVIAGAWGLGEVLQVLGTISGIDMFLGVVLQLASSSNRDGQLVVDESNPDKDIYSLEVDGEPHDWKQKDKVVLRVVRQK